MKNLILILLEVGNDIKELKKDVEMLKNKQLNMKTDLTSSIQASVVKINEKVDKELKEQKEYVNTLHQDIDETIKRAKRDKSDNYLEINKLNNKLKVIDIIARKTEENVIITSGAYQKILESIKSHLDLLQKKEKKEIDKKIEQDSLQPYVASEGDILNELNRK